MIDETAAEIRELQTHSSSVVAVKAAEALHELTDREFESVEEYLRSLERNSSALRRANSSHVSLQQTQRDLVSRVKDAEPDTVAAAKEATEAAIAGVVSELESAKEAAASALAERLSDGDTVLTHDFSTTVITAIEGAAAEGAELDVYVTEARPRFMGRRTARRLATVGNVDTTLITDTAAGVYLPDCDFVAVGMDCVVESTLYNRVGTYPLAATAADCDVTFVTAGTEAKMREGRFRFENDFRSVGEVIREPPEGFGVENPAYDGTPMRLIDFVITEEGVQEP
jgi:translation initiation factor eIF-2B subunit delta